MDADLHYLEIRDAAHLLAERAPATNGHGQPIVGVYGVPRGGLVPAALVAGALDLPLVETVDSRTLVVDDLVDTGETLRRYVNVAGHVDALFRKPASPEDLAPGAVIRDGWLVFPWERAQNEAPATDAVRRLLLAIGEDPDRDGLRDTPARVLKAWREMTEGHQADLGAILATQFDNSYNGMVVVRNIDFTSLCEHHVIPFVGVAHVAYVPAGGRVVGLSKLARVVDAFSRRLQIQERLTEQIAEAIEEYLEPVAVGVVVEAKHACMACRGVRKQRASMVTSALRGRMWEAPMRSEFLALVASADV